jgi:hypothetical protein
MCSLLTLRGGIFDCPKIVGLSPHLGDLVGLFVLCIERVLIIEERAVFLLFYQY